MDKFPSSKLRKVVGAINCTDFNYNINTSTVLNRLSEFDYTLLVAISDLLKNDTICMLQVKCELLLCGIVLPESLDFAL